jgi:non-specific serine/threonine protein kinase
MALAHQGNHQAATSLYEEALVLFRALDERWWTSWTLRNLSPVVCAQGDTGRASDLLQESLAISQELGDRRGTGWCLHYLGMVADAQGKRTRAIAFHQESLAVFRDAHHPWGVAAALGRLGALLHAQGEHVTAIHLHAESLALMWQIGDRNGIADALLGLSEIWATFGTGEHLDRAARSLGAVEAIRQALRGGPPLADCVRYDRQLAIVCAGLGDDAFAVARAAGRTVPLAQSVADALAWANDVHPETTPPVAAPTGRAGAVLTPREREVAALLVRGMSDRKIAAELVISERTAEKHVANILGKLGCTSRAQAAVWVTKHVVPAGPAT